MFLLSTFTSYFSLSSFSFPQSFLLCPFFFLLSASISCSHAFFFSPVSTLFFLQSFLLCPFFTRFFFARPMIPGEIIPAAAAAALEANTNLATVTLEVTNTGDRPIQVGSHYHFFETNEALRFDRTSTRGFRLNIPAGTAVRFEAGDTKRVELVALAGRREVFGLNAKINGLLDAKPKTRAAKTARRKRRVEGRR